MPKMNKNNKKKILHEHVTNNLVMYPSEKSQYTYTIPNFAELLVAHCQHDKIFRKTRIKYRSLAGGRDYKYESRFEYIPAEKRWLENKIIGN